MKIGVSGASGHVGAAVIQSLLRSATGHGLVAISRTPPSIGEVEGRLGDYDQPRTLVAAYAGLDRLLIIPSADLRPGMRGAQVAAAIDAAVAAGVKHVFLLSACGTSRKQEPAIGAAYWTGEQRLIASDIAAWTILRMNYFSETLVQEARMALDHGVMTGLADNRVAFVSREDVAVALVGALLADHQEGLIHHLTGPDRLSGPERAAAVAAATGKPMGFAIITDAQLRTGLVQAGLPGFIVDAIASMQASQADGAYDIVSGDVERLSGRPPTPLYQVLEREFAA